jgi:hypothetical protein
MVIASAVRESGNKMPELSHDLLAERIVALAESGRVEARGNLSDWRRSEIRLTA